MVLTSSGTFVSFSNDLEPAPYVPDERGDQGLARRPPSRAATLKITPRGPSAFITSALIIFASQGTGDDHPAYPPPSPSRSGRDNACGIRPRRTLRNDRPPARARHPSRRAIAWPLRPMPTHPDFGSLDRPTLKGKFCFILCRNANAVGLERTRARPRSKAPSRYPDLLVRTSGGVVTNDICCARSCIDDRSLRRKRTRSRALKTRKRLACRPHRVVGQPRADADFLPPLR